jgi:hypothetical protein
MHRQHSPLTSGRVVLWRTIPFLAISPLITTFLPGHDIPIYLAVLYAFLLLLLIQYRNLCHEWSSWSSRVPRTTAKDVSDWYQNQITTDYDGEKCVLVNEALERAAQSAFQAAVDDLLRNRTQRGTTIDPLVIEAAKGLPLSLWLLEKENPIPAKKAVNKAEASSELFTTIWFSKVEQALESQQKLVQGLKEHSTFVLFRHGKYDVRLNSLLY